MSAAFPGQPLQIQTWTSHSFGDPYVYSIYFRFDQPTASVRRYRADIDAVQACERSGEALDAVEVVDGVVPREALDAIVERGRAIRVSPFVETVIGLDGGRVGLHIFGAFNEVRWEIWSSRPQAELVDWIVEFHDFLDECLGSRRRRWRDSAE
jgi:hypothetical protein